MPARRFRGSDADGDPPRWKELGHSLPPLPDPEDERDIVWQHLGAELVWYHRAAKRTRLAYQVAKTVSLVVAAIVPIVAALRGPAAVTASLAAIVVIVEGALQLFQFHANWITYRTTAESLRQHSLMYASRVGPYSDPRTRRIVLAERIQELIATENTTWSTTMRQPAAGTNAGS